MPFRYAAGINTPMLVIHGESDLRLPPEQAESLFVALRLSRRDMEYWWCPEDSHDLSRSGTPAYPIERAELITEWFRRHLEFRGDHTAARKARSGLEVGNMEVTSPSGSTQSPRGRSDV